MVDGDRSSCSHMHSLCPRTAGSLALVMLSALGWPAARGSPTCLQDRDSASRVTCTTDRG